MESFKGKVPIIDLDRVNINLSESEIDVEEVKHVGTDIIKALVDSGFFYIKNHGIVPEDIKACSEAGNNFFDLSADVKLARLRTNAEKTICGYVPIPGKYGRDIPYEQFDKSTAPGYKEVFNACHLCSPSIWPDEELPQLRTSFMSIIEQSERLTNRLLLLIGHGLTPDRPEYFQNGFRERGTGGNRSGLKIVRYPAAPQSVVQRDGVRCGEHTDTGLITLLFLDSTPGLQLFSRQDKCYIDVNMIEDTILINIGAFFQRWTSDVLHAGIHRVVFRPDTINRDRFSLIYFSEPDNEAVITSIVEPLNRYPPVKAVDYYNQRVKQQYVHHEGIDSELNIL